MPILVYSISKICQIINIYLWLYPVYWGKYEGNVQMEDVLATTKRHSGIHADHTKELPRLRRIAGQLEGVEKMIHERRYCPEIIQQIRAVGSAVKALELELLRGHLGSCIRHSAIEDSSQDFEKKLDEILKVIKF